MSLQHVPADHPPTTGTPVRVFPGVAPTPRLPAPTWWTNPLVVLPATVVVTVNLVHLRGLPAATPLVILAISVTLTVLGTLSYFAWPDSREAAAREAAWVARQSGYPVSAHGEDLHWTDLDGRTRIAVLSPGTAGWDLLLTAHDAA